MSIQVANINLSAAVMGTTGNIPLSNMLPPATLAQQMHPQIADGSNLVLWNESGCGLTCTFPVSGESLTVPAGAWRVLRVPPNEIQLNYTVIYVLATAQVALLLADLYWPGEPVEPVGVLGNTPISQSRVIAIPPVPHRNAPFSTARTLSTLGATIYTLFHYLAIPQDGLPHVTTAYLYGLSLQLQGMRWADVQLLVGEDNPPSGGWGSNFTVVYETVLYAGVPLPPVPLLAQQVTITATSPNDFVALGARIQACYPNGSGQPFTLVGSALADMDTSGTPPPPAIGNGAATPIGVTY